MEQAFLQAIIDRPDDDTPRLIFADWLDERGRPGDADRAEFIRLQCACGMGDFPSMREMDLLSEHRREWIKPLLDLIPDLKDREIGFYHGFPCIITIHRMKDINLIPELLKVAPIREVNLRSREVMGPTDDLSEMLHIPEVQALAKDLENGRYPTIKHVGINVDQH